jgi:hypothetical protein
MPTGIRYPFGLPVPDRDGYRETFEETRSVVDMESGTARRRNRMRRPARLFALRTTLSQQQFAVFDEFWQVHIKGSESEFDIQLADDDEAALVWYTVRATDGTYQATVTEAADYVVEWAVRAVADGFSVRDPGTALLRGSASIGIASAIAIQKARIALRGTASLGIKTSGLPLRSGGRFLAQPYNGRSVVGIKAATGRINRPPGWVLRLSGIAVRSIASSSDGAKLVTAAGSSLGTIRTSTDYGATWTARQAASSGGAVWEGAASSADGTKLVFVLSNGRIWTSVDSGVTWTARATTQTWQAVGSSSDGVKLVAVGFNTPIWTSVDSGVTWTAREFARLWRAVCSSQDGTKLLAAVDTGQLYTSTDSGVTWTARNTNRTWKGVACSADGTKLVAVVDNGQIYTSTDSGATWTARESNRRWQDVASSANGINLVAVTFTGGVYRSSDSGVTWALSLTGNAFIAAASSADGSRLAIGGEALQALYTYSP